MCVIQAFKRFTAVTVEKMHQMNGAKSEFSILLSTACENKNPAVHLHCCQKCKANGMSRTTLPTYKSMPFNPIASTHMALIHVILRPAGCVPFKCGKLIVSPS
jgi:hypothetical protein